MNTLNHSISSMGAFAPAFCLLLFFAASFLVIWRLEVLSGKGVEGTVLGTIFMPFCSGMGNIVFAFVLARHAGSGGDVLVNCLFNNITNLTLLIGAPVLIWSMSGIPVKKGKVAAREHEVGRLALVLNLVAALFFSLITWLLLASDGQLSMTDGFVFLALFVFWQCFHIYDVKKTNLLKKKQYPKTLPLEVVLLLIGAFVVLVSTDWLVQWFQEFDDEHVPAGLLGWLSGLLMVLPNALLAFYYGSKNRMDVVYTSQSGDAHICIPLCLGIFAVFRPIETTPFMQQALLALIALCAAHLLVIAIAGRLPRVMAAGLLGVFGWFLWAGLGAG